MRALAAALFASGLALLALNVIKGEGAAGVVVFIPFFYGTGPLASLAAVLLFLGLFCLIFGLAGAGAAPSRDLKDGGRVAGEMESGGEARDRPTGKDIWRVLGENGRREDGGKHRAGAVVLIGPVPIVYGSDPGMARWMLALALLLMAALVAVFILVAII